MFGQINSRYDDTRQKSETSAFISSLKPVPEPYRVPDYVPQPDEHELANKFGMLKKNFLTLMLNTQALTCNDLEMQPAVDENAGLFVTGFCSNGILTAEMILEVFATLGSPQDAGLAQQFAFLFNSFMANNNLTVNNLFLGIMLTFVYHECGGIVPIHEKRGGINTNLDYWTPTGPYGKVYYGRGLIQLTWESAYKRFESYCQSLPQYKHLHPHSDPDILVSNYEAAVVSMLWEILYAYADMRTYKYMMQGDLRNATALVAGRGVLNPNGRFAGYIPARAKTLSVVQPIVDKHIMMGGGSYGAYPGGFGGAILGASSKGAAAVMWWKQNILGRMLKYENVAFHVLSDGRICTDCSKGVIAAYNYGAGMCIPICSCNELIQMGQWVDPPRLHPHTHQRLNPAGPNISVLQPGDWLFYKGNQTQRPYAVSHIEIYLGGGYNSGTGKGGVPVKAKSTATYRLNDYIGAKRIM